MPCIAIFRTGGIGDVILSTVALKIIQDLQPHTELHWFGRQPTLELIRTAFPSVHTHEFLPGASYRQNIHLVKSAATRFDLIIDLQRSARTIVIGSLCSVYFGCAYVTWNKYSMERSMFVFQSLLKKRQLLHKTASLPRRHEAMAARVISALKQQKLLSDDLKFTTGQPEIPVPNPTKKNAIAINLGVLYKSKELPFDKWQELINHIRLRQCCQEVYFLGDQKQFELAEKLIVCLGKQILGQNYCGKTSLSEAAQLLAACTCTLTNDSALSHLSESVGTPVIVFFGPTHEQFGYRPFLKESKSISLPLSCRPCTKGGLTNCRFGDFKCFHDLDMQLAIKQINQLTNCEPAS